MRGLITGLPVEVREVIYIYIKTLWLPMNPSGDIGKTIFGDRDDLDRPKIKICEENFDEI